MNLCTRGEGGSKKPKNLRTYLMEAPLDEIIAFNFELTLILAGSIFHGRTGGTLREMKVDISAASQSRWSGSQGRTFGCQQFICGTL